MKPFFWFHNIVCVLLAGSCTWASASGCRTPALTVEARANSAILGPVKWQVAYPSIPSAGELHLPATPPRRIDDKQAFLSPGLCDPYLEEARNLKVYDDFKILSDGRERPLTAAERSRLLQAASRAAKVGGRRAFLRTYLEGAYDFSDQLGAAADIVKPEWKISTGDAALDTAFAYTETVLPRLVRLSPSGFEGSFLPAPYPILIAAPGRFRESYYWDTYFGVKGVLATARLELAQMQADNLLEEVRRYGFVPNGSRDYYLSRSQPPFLSSLIREVYEATSDSRRLDWLRRRAYPLAKNDYEKFWMNPRTRFDASTGLNHDWDALNSPRPERHGLDREEKLGRTYRDVRAAAESGLDFTVAMQGQATQIAGVLLNSVLYKTERDLEWAAGELGLKADAVHFRRAAEHRRRSIDRYLWNPARAEYENYNLGTCSSVPILTAVAFVPLFVGASSQVQAERMRAKLPVLERKGGVMASVSTGSPYQWDGNNGWAPLQIMAIEGLRRYGYREDARRIASSWVRVIAKVQKKTGVIFERYDVAKADYPDLDGDKYPSQTGFLWTNSSLVWALTRVLEFKLVKLSSRDVLSR